MENKNILFIGNSYTHCNEMPFMIKSFAQQLNVNLNVVLAAPGGQTFEGHLFGGDTINKINSLKEGEWDFLVMQEKSYRPIDDRERMLTYGAELAKLIKRKKTCFYATWARKHLPHTQETIDQSYLELAKIVGGDIAPAGRAWELMQIKHKELSLFVEDYSHPTFLGSYLSACTLFAVLFDQSPMGLSHEFYFQENVKTTLNEEIAHKAQSVVLKTLEQYTPMRF